MSWVNGEDDGLPIELFRAQTSPISRLEHSRDGRRLLVCADWGEPALNVARLLPTSDMSNTANTASPWTTNPDDLAQVLFQFTSTACMLELQITNDVLQGCRPRSLASLGNR